MYTKYVVQIYSCTISFSTLIQQCRKNSFNGVRNAIFYLTKSAGKTRPKINESIWGFFNDKDKSFQALPLNVNNPKTFNAKQFYVSVSRAREKVRIYTSDKEELLNRANQAGDRVGAVELVKSNSTLHMEHVLMLQRQQEIASGLQHIRQSQKTIKPHPQQPNQYEDYEPGL